MQEKTETTMWRVDRQFGERGSGTIQKETSEEGTLEVHKFVTDPARVNVDFGFTVNMGNYEFVRIDVGISVPCYKEEADEAYEHAKEWASSRVKEEIADAKKVRSW